MRAVLFDLLGAAGLGLLTWALWEVDTRLARGVLGSALMLIAVAGAYAQAQRP